MTSQHTTQSKTSENDRASQATAKAKSASPTALHPMLHLQRQVGNQVVGRLIQAKLTVGEANDVYEQEADRVAAEVVKQIHTPKIASTNQSASVQRQTVGNEAEKLQTKPLIQCKSDVGGMAVSSEIESSIQKARGGGQPLAESIRTPMEQAFGSDFSGVRVHTDDRSHQLNQSIQAKAFTTGQDIFFRQGEYSPGSRGGQELLAHELTHVVQQCALISRRSEIQRTSTQINACKEVGFSFLSQKQSSLIQRQATSTGVRMEHAKKIYKNYIKGDPPFKPQKGNFGKISWFKGRGNPYVGGQAQQYDVTIGVEAKRQPRKLAEDWFEDILDTWDPGKNKRQYKSTHHEFWEQLGISLEGQGLAEVYVPKGPLSLQGDGTFICADSSARRDIVLSDPQQLRRDIGASVNSIVENVNTKINSLATQGNDAKTFTVKMDCVRSTVKPFELSAKLGTIVDPPIKGIFSREENQVDNKLDSDTVAATTATVTAMLTYADYKQARKNAKTLSTRIQELSDYGTVTLFGGKGWTTKAIRPYTENY